MRRPPGRTVLAILFAALALNAWRQVALVALGRAENPPALVAFQTCIGAAGLAAAWGCWTGARWAPAAALVHGVVTAVMLASLVPVLDLPAEARGGLWGGAAGVLTFALGAAWYLRRARRAAVGG